MKNLFEVDDSEKKRIIEMHLTATKKQYLINEQDIQGITRELKPAFNILINNRSAFVIDGGGNDNLVISFTIGSVTNGVANGYWYFYNEWYQNRDGKNEILQGPLTYNTTDKTIIGYDKSNNIAFNVKNEKSAAYNAIVKKYLYWFFNSNSVNDDDEFSDALATLAGQIGVQITPDSELGKKTGQVAPAEDESTGDESLTGDESSVGETPTEEPKDYGEYQGGTRKYTKNTNVVAFQDALNLLGFNPGKSDGKFGPKTLEALKKFQEKNGLASSSGKLDKATATKLVQKMTERSGELKALNNSTSLGVAQNYDKTLGDLKGIAGI